MHIFIRKIFSFLLGTFWFSTFLQFYQSKETNAIKKPPSVLNINA